MSGGLLFVAIGTMGGLLAGLFGVGGGIVIVPALIYLAGFTQHQATGTSLAVLLPPIGLGAAIEYYRHGNVNVRAAIILAITMLIGTWLGSLVANKISGPYLRLMFAVFVWFLGGYLIYGACHRLGWL
ncbi:MAG: sulfite exporter TauE/SafE family protein [Deltaproteobacteria bacterium]|nr:sulfite exporter TauE/SafE family protein [Deltaproteobacteria bacterium]MBM4298037.1 sulfite exporter TauE/SafE family protein [Deltaproteobacteria bacterium]